MDGGTNQRVKLVAFAFRAIPVLTILPFKTIDSATFPETCVISGARHQQAGRNSDGYAGIRQLQGQVFGREAEIYTKVILCPELAN